MGLNAVPKSRNKTASGTGGVNEDWLRMSWELARPDHAGLWSWGKGIEFYVQQESLR